MFKSGVKIVAIFFNKVYSQPATGGTSPAPGPPHNSGQPSHNQAPGPPHSQGPPHNQSQPPQQPQPSYNYAGIFVFDLCGLNGSSCFVS